EYKTQCTRPATPSGRCQIHNRPRSIPPPTQAKLVALGRAIERHKQQIKRLRDKRKPLELTFIALLEKESQLTATIEQLKASIKDGQAQRMAYTPASGAGAASWKG